MGPLLPCRPGASAAIRRPQKLRPLEANMKRPLLWSLVGATLALTGCHDGRDHGCLADVECAPGYVCEPLRSECVRPSPPCDSPADCRTNETCGSDQECHVGDCSFH